MIDKVVENQHFVHISGHVVVVRRQHSPHNHLHLFESEFNPGYKPHKGALVNGSKADIVEYLNKHAYHD